MKRRGMAVSFSTAALELSPLEKHFVEQIKKNYDYVLDT